MGVSYNNVIMIDYLLCKGIMLEITFIKVKSQRQKCLLQFKKKYT